MKIVTCESREEGEVVINGINTYNDSKTERILSVVHEDVRLVAKNEKDEIIGGIFGSVGYYAGFNISTLWVREDARDKKVGSKLLIKAEEKAKKIGAKLAILDTFSFQAKDFYIKNGYEVFGEIKDFPKVNQEFIFLKKIL